MLPEFTEAQALAFIAAISGGLWLILFAGFTATHVHNVRRTRK